MRLVFRLLVSVIVLAVLASIPVMAYAAAGTRAELSLSLSELGFIAVGVLALIGSGSALRRASRPRRSTSR